MSGPNRRAPSPLDVHIGKRVRLYRTLLGLSQERLARALGLSFQQIQKYERGVNRIGASRLYEIAGVLDIPVVFFFEDAPLGDADAAAASSRADTAREASGAPKDNDEHETMALVRAWCEVADPAVRKRLFSLVRTAGGATRRRKMRGC